MGSLLLVAVTVVMVHGLAVHWCRRRGLLRAGRETEAHGRDCDDGESTHVIVSPPSVQGACGGDVVGLGNL